jgi:hypothetical protein
MRRRVFHLALGAAAALLSPSVLAVTQRSDVEKRLLGIWRSDRERTTAYWKYKKEVAEEVRERFENMFGKLTLRFTKSHIHSEFDGTRDVIPYSVVAQDATSVVIKWHERKGSFLQQIHFDGASYYVVSGYNIEFYKRVG